MSIPNNLLDLLDSAMLAHIAAFAPPSPLNAPFRAICPRFRALIERPQGMNIEQLLAHGARIGSRYMCEYAHDRGAENFDDALHDAVRGGHRDMCFLIRELYVGSQDSFDYNEMLDVAVQCGNRELCVLAHEWVLGLPFEEDSTNFYAIIESAARLGSRELCELIRKWVLESDDEPMNYSSMLEGASWIGDRALCELAREWSMESGVRLDFNGAMRAAVRCGHRELCILIHEWARNQGSRSPDYEDMLRRAVRGGRSDDPLSMAKQRELCILAREWAREAGQSLNFREMRDDATRLKRADLISLANEFMRDHAREWGRLDKIEDDSGDESD